MSRHLQQKFCYMSSRQCLDNIFSPIFKNSGKKLIFLKNNCFGVSHMDCEARLLSLMVFLSFPQSNFYFQKGCMCFCYHIWETPFTDTNFSWKWIRPLPDQSAFSFITKYVPVWLFLVSYFQVYTLRFLSIHVIENSKRFWTS